MTEKTQFGTDGPLVDCTTFEARLSELMDGTLAGEELARYRTHATACNVCGPLFTLSQEGREWMSCLAAVEPPSRMVHNILAKTSLEDVAKAAGHVQAHKGWLRRISDMISPQLAPMMQRMMQPRMAMTCASVFFSVSLGLNMAGVRGSDIQDFINNPASITTKTSIKYHETTARVVKYYDNIRVVMELQARFEQLKNATTNIQEEDKKKQDQQNDKKPDQKDGEKPADNTSEKNKQNRNYDIFRDADTLSAARPSPRSNPAAQDILS